MRAYVLIAIGGAVLIGVAALSAVLAVHHRSSNAPSLPTSPYRGSVPPPGIRAPDFTLRDYRGGRVTMSSFRGRIVVLSFVDSKCTTKCPIVTSVVASAMRRLRPAARSEVVALLMSVSPRLDTPASIHRFLAARRALALSYLVGSVQQMRPIWKAYGILAAADTGNADIHSSDVRIFDRRGIWVSTQHAGEDLTAANLDHDVLLALKRS
jgi:cytochrome oxidase Cu insertion factor (SCO1/SenC/PrrC family)